MITGVHKMVIAVGDQEAAKEFWTKQMGFEVNLDESFGKGQRWLEVRPANGDDIIVLAPRNGEVRPSVPDELPHSPLFFNCDDIERTHRELTARGVKFAAPPAKMPFGWWSMFEDHEGTRYALGQW